MYRIFNFNGILWFIQISGFLCKEQDEQCSDQMVCHKLKAFNGTMTEETKAVNNQKNGVENPDNSKNSISPIFGLPTF